MKTNKELLISLLIGIVVMIAIACYFGAPALKGEVLKQHDIEQYKGSAQETEKYMKEEGKEILWTNSMFSGMPNYVVALHYKGNVFGKIHLFLKTIFPHPIGYIFLMMLNFFILLLIMRINPIAALSGAVAFAFSTYFIVILAAGHNAKVDAIVWLPGVFAGLYLAYRRNLWAGAALFGFYFAIEIAASHPQMVYYFAFLALAFVLVEEIGLFLEGKVLQAVKTAAVLGVVAALAVGTNWSYLKTTNDYAKYSIRGKSELTLNAEDKTSGLDRSYVTQWSNGIGETWTLLIPNFKGGASGDMSGNKTAISSVSAAERQMLRGANAYFGDQPVTGGPVYAGAGIFLLFILGLFFVKDRIKWAFIAAAVFTLMMSWGRHFPAFTNFMLDHFPLYSKFRAVLSAIVIPELIIPILAMLCAALIMAEPEFFKKKASIFKFELPFENDKVFYGIAGTLIFLLFAMWLLPGLFNSFFAAGEEIELSNQLLEMGANNGQVSDFINTIETARIAIFKADVLRSLFFVLTTAVSIWAYVRFKFNKYIFGAILFAITAADMISVNKRYLSGDNFENKKEAKFTPTTADNYILQDKDANYRVANLAVSIFNDATTSYYHKSIGGYHGAKLKKYQEVIEYGITPELEKMYTVLGNRPNPEQVNNLLQNLHVLNMLNTKYFILNPSAPPLENPYALGNAWFPSSIVWVNNADEEITTLQEIDTRKTTVIDSKFKNDLVNSINADSTSRITETSYHPEQMIYESSAASDQVAIFSEVWYPEGWKCYIDGKETPIARANYVLRAIKVPAGKHNIEFKFEPSFKSDEKISLLVSLILLVFVLGVAVKELYPIFKNKSVQAK